MIDMFISSDYIRSLLIIIIELSAVYKLPSARVYLVVAVSTHLYVVLTALRIYSDVYKIYSDQNSYDLCYQVYR